MHCFGIGSCIENAQSKIIRPIQPRVSISLVRSSFVDKLWDSFYLFSPKILNLRYTKEHKISHPSLIALELYVIEVCLFLHAGLLEFTVILSPKQFKQHVLCYKDQEWTPLSDSSLQVKEISRKTTSQ